MKFDEITRNAKQGKFAPIYFLHGEEPYFIDRISNTIQTHALEPHERDFNETIFYGQDTNVINLVHAAQRFPMGATRQLIILREAQMLDKLELLESYVRNPLISTILVVNYKYKTIDGRSKLAAALKKQDKAIVFESKPIYDNQIEQWINTCLAEKQLTIEAKASEMLTGFIGTNLEKLYQAIDKLEVSLEPGKKIITADLVARNIGISKEYNIFELQKALINKNIPKSNQIVFAFAANPKKYPIALVTASLFNYFSKLLVYSSLKDKSKNAVATALNINPYFVADYQTGSKNYPERKIVENISLLREYDMKSKGFGNSNTQGGELLKELIFKILH